MARSELVPTYVNNTRVLNDPGLREQVLERAVAEQRSWAMRYRHLNELQAHVRAVEKFCKRFAPAEV